MSEEGTAQEVSPEGAMEQHVADTREEAIKAVREAVAAETPPDDEDSPAPAKSDATEAAPDRGKDGKFLPKDGKPGLAKTKEGEPPAEEEVNNSKIAKLLREREERNEQRTQLRQEREAFERERQSFAQEREQIKKDREWLARLRTDPKAAVREAHAAHGDAWSPEEFIMALAKDGTAEGTLERKNQALEQKLANIEQMIETYTKSENQLREEANRRYLNQTAQSTEKRFVGVALNAERFPDLVEYYEDDPQYLIDTAHKVGQQYHAKTGEWASDEEIAIYLDGLRKERKTKKNSHTQGSAAGQAPPPRASGSRTITTASASEKRVVSRAPDEEMSEEERRAEAIKAVRQALRENAHSG